MIKVKDEKGLARDPYSKAILQTDLKQLVEHRRRKSAFRNLAQEASKVKVLEERLDKQDKEIAELKEMVAKLVS